MKTLILTLTVIFGLQLSGPELYCQNHTLLKDKISLYSNEKNKQSLIIEDKITNENKYLLAAPEKSLFSGLMNAGNDSTIVNADMRPKKKKSIGLGVLLSALLPGAGEFYGENYLKAGIFLGVELLAWGTYFYFNNKGDNKTDEFQKYADTYWDVRTYARWLKDENFRDNGGIDPDEPDLNVLRQEIMICEQSNFSHTMPEYYSQQFYELIGKYQNFQAGWINLAHRPTKAPGPYWYETYHDPVFTNYAIERDKANDFYNYAKIGPITVIVNHILSAADAAWVISAYNSKIKLQTGFRIENRISPYTYKIEQMPTFNLSVNF